MRARNDEAIVIKIAPVLKKKKRTSRDVIIRLDELNPLSFNLVDLIDRWPYGLRGFRASMLVHERDFRVQQLDARALNR